MKKNILIYKKKPCRFMLICFCIIALSLNITGLYSQQLFRYQQSPALNEQQQKYAQTWINKTSTGTYAYATFNKSQLDEVSIIFNTPDGREFSVTRARINERNKNDFSWFGTISNTEDRLNLVYHNGMLTGFFQMKGNKWKVHPLGEGLHLIYNVNSSEFEDESDADYMNMLKQAIAPHSVPADNPEAEDGMVSGDCKIRVLVAYTNAAETEIGADVNGFIQSCIDVTNDCYSNSSVSFDIELARSQKVSYTESGNAGTDKTRFRNTADGFMDEIHSTRTYYDADLNVLLVSTLESGICGSAYTVDVSPYSDAFCVCKVSCAVDNYTFPHELGHLYGCRHDVYVDGTDDPYAYGHGYVNLDEEWRTVMAYNDLCEDNSADCERLPYFSNPGVTYGGDAMGVPGESDNESALEASMSDIASLESTVSAKSLPSETIDDDEKGDVIATTSVTNTDTYIISSGADITWRAGSSITLALNFTASSGSVFNAFLDDCDALRLASEESSGNEEISIKNTLIVYPNPFHHTANVSIMLNADAIVTIRLIDILGNQILNLSDAKYYSEGQHVFPVNDPELGSGIYFVEANINGERKLHEIIKVD